MEIQIVLTTDNSFFSRLARLLGAEWTHAMLRFPVLWECAWTGVWGMTQSATRPDPVYNIIEATMRRGVIERRWNGDEHSKYRAYRLAEDFEAWGELLAFARGNIGKRYAFEQLGLLIPDFLNRYGIFQRKVLAYRQGASYYNLWGTGQICTSLVDHCFLEHHIDLVPEKSKIWVLPDDIRDSPLLELLPPEGTVEWKEG